MLRAEMSTLDNACGRSVRGRTVCPGPKRPRPKCPWPKSPSTRHTLPLTIQCKLQRGFGKPVYKLYMCILQHI